MVDELVTFLNARLDEEAELARRCGQAGGGAEVRGVREVEAKRRVLGRHMLSPAEGDPERPWDDRDDCQYDGELWPCDDLLDLAVAYLDHPDSPERYRPRADAVDGEGGGG